MRSIIGILVLIASVCGADILFEDYFDDGNADGWTEYTNYPDSANYYVQDGWYHFDIEEIDGSVASMNGDESDTTPHYMSIPDYSIFCKVCAYDQTDHIGVIARAQAPLTDEFAYIAWLNLSLQEIELWRHDGPGTYIELAQVAFVIELNADYWIRFDLWGGFLRVKVWQGSLEDEPGNYLVSAYDNTYTDPGSIGMIAHSWGLNHVHAAFDSVLVCEPPVSLDQSTWGSIKSVFFE